MEEKLYFLLPIGLVEPGKTGIITDKKSTFCTFDGKNKGAAAFAVEQCLLFV
jgi:hypothetical protein